jgi:hypothetical protein
MALTNYTSSFMTFPLVNQTSVSTTVFNRTTYILPANCAYQGSDFCCIDGNTTYCYAFSDINEFISTYEAALCTEI